MLAELDCVSPSSVTLHVVPLARPLSVNVTDGVVTVNVADAVSDGTVLTSDPVAVTVYAADVPDVIVTVQLKLPAELPNSVTVHVSLDVTLAPGLIVNTIVTAPPVSVVGVNPVPATVPDVPLDPWLGVSVIAGTVPVNVAVAVSPAVFPVAVTVFAVPLLLNEKPVDVLAVKVQPENDPELTVQVLLLKEVDPTSNVTLVSVDANPLPDAVTVTPLGPDDGVRVRLSISTGAEAVSAGEAVSLAVIV